MKTAVRNQEVHVSIVYHNRTLECVYRCRFPYPPVSLVAPSFLYLSSLVIDDKLYYMIQNDRGTCHPSKEVEKCPQWHVTTCCGLRSSNKGEGALD